MSRTATAREIIIDIPSLPPSILLPNRKCHWARKHRAAQEYSQTVKLCAIDARNRCGDWPTLPRATVQIIVTYPFVLGRRKIPDPDNLMAALKPAIDALTARDRNNGVTGAGIIEDDGPEHVTWLPLLIGRDERESVRIIVREVL